MKLVKIDLKLSLRSFDGSVDWGHLDTADTFSINDGNSDISIFSP